MNKKRLWIIFCMCIVIIGFVASSSTISNDDFVGYMPWDSTFGPAPIRLLVMPDPHKPYWADSWKADGYDFGRRKWCDKNHPQQVMGER